VYQDHRGTQLASLDLGRSVDALRAVDESVMTVASCRFVTLTNAPFNHYSKYDSKMRLAASTVRKPLYVCEGPRRDPGQIGGS